MLIPVVTDAKKAAGALNWGVLEMTNRYQLFAQYNVRNLQGYNEKVKQITGTEEGNEELKNIESACLTPELWERRRYEVAKEVLIKMLGTSNHCDMQRALNEEINKSIDIATTFIKKLKVISENEMLDGDWK